MFTHLSHPEWGLINLVDGHECLHIVKQEHIVEDGGKKGQRAIQHSSREDTLPVAPDAPSHSSQSLCFVLSLHQAAIISRPGRPWVTTSLWPEKHSAVLKSYFQSSRQSITGGYCSVPWLNLRIAKHYSDILDSVSPESEETEGSCKHQLVWPGASVPFYFGPRPAVCECVSRKVHHTAVILIFLITTTSLSQMFILIHFLTHSTFGRQLT